jgi:hypothetical protein
LTSKGTTAQAVDLDFQIIRLGALCAANIPMIFGARGKVLDPADWPLEAQVGVKRLRCSKYGVGVHMHSKVEALAAALIFAQLKERGVPEQEAMQDALRNAPAALRRLIEHGEPGKMVRFTRAVRRLPLRLRVRPSYARPLRRRRTAPSG